MSDSQTPQAAGPLDTPLIETARRAEGGLVGWRLDRLRDALAGPLCIVGAGGSRTVARLWAGLHRRAGHPAHAPSPLDVRLDPPLHPVLMLSGSGRHHDILGAAEAALRAGRAVHAVTTNPDAPLIDRVRRADASHHTVALTGPAVKEGLAARHALVPMALLAARLHGVDGVAAVEAFEGSPADIERAERLAAARPSDVVALGAGLARPAADVFAHLVRESGFAPARAADPREFAHGQFMAAGPRTWLVWFAVDEQRPWAEPMWQGQPRSVTRIAGSGPAGALQIYARALNTAGALMRAAGATPGRADIPPWGAKLYRMKLGAVEHMEQAPEMKNQG